ncbi:hypothetical protein AXX17_AT5G10860 [Arabidopsis thaliana]|nr:hypothetical protein AXX17_AT5G10860 [Arabidopsis thaliana]
MRQMPYAVPYEYIPFETPDGKPRGSYDEMVYHVFLGEFDGAVGDTTILANRSTYVDFALPYSETGIVVVVPVKDEREKGKWVFLKPLTRELWFLTAASFLYIGIMVWIFEYQANVRPSESIFTRVLVVVWCFVLLILTQSYTATLTSMLTVQELRPTVRHMDDLRNSGVNIGYQTGSFTFERLKQMGYKESRLKTYDTSQEMHELFLKKSSNGGIDAAFDEVAYVKLFMAKYCSKYTIIEPTFKADGFGFAFPLGSPLVPDLSRQILNITEGETMKAIENKWLLGEKHCLDSTTSDSPIRLDHHSFEALFTIVFVVSMLLLLAMLVCRRYRQESKSGEINANNSPTDGNMRAPPNQPTDDNMRAPTSPPIDDQVLEPPGPALNEADDQDQLLNDEVNVGDRNEVDIIVEVDPTLVHRRNLITSKTIPTRRAALFSRIKSA